MYSISGTRSRMNTARAALSFPPDRLRMCRVLPDDACFILPPKPESSTTPARWRSAQQPCALSPLTRAFPENRESVHLEFHQRKLLSGPPNHLPPLSTLALVRSSFPCRASGRLSLPRVQNVQRVVATLAENAHSRSPSISPVEPSRVDFQATRSRL